MAIGCGPGDNNSTQDECTTNADCGANQFCSDENKCEDRGNTPQSCTRDVQCDFDEYCAAGQCAPRACAEDTECAEGAICDSNECRTGCRENGDCGDTEVCSDLTNTCQPAGCLSTGCVPNFETCDESGEVPRCIPTGQCMDDGNCAVYANYLDDGEDYICDTNQQRCVVKPPCGSDNDCPIGDICEEREGERNRCRPGCRDDDACAVGEFCDLDGTYSPVGAEYEQFVCIRGCTSDMDCNTLLNDPNGDYACLDLLCISKCEGVDDCEAGQICTGQPNTCQGCTDDNQCPATQFCDKTQGYSEEDIADPTLGLCTDLPPDCPPDGYGENQDLANAYRIETFPFVADGTSPDIVQPNYCQENNNAGEWFVVPAMPGKIITVTMSYDAQGANLDLALKNSTGGDLVTSERPPTEDQGMESISYGVELGDDYYIQVRGGIAQKALPYTLTVDVSDPPPCRDDSFEENDSASSPSPLPADTDHAMLQVCGTDRDFYELDIKANQVVKIETIAPVRAGDIDLFVTTPAGDPVANASTDQDNETLIFATEAAGTFILEVVVAGAVGNVDYDLRWSERDNECSDVFDAAPGNNTCADAVMLPLTPVAMTDPPVSAYNNAEELRVCTDSDWYAIDLLPLQTVRLTATYDARQSAGFIDFRLRGPEACDVIAAFDTRERDPVDPNIVRQRLEYTATNGGRFYIAATLAQGLNVTYDLNVEIEDGPACPDDDFEANDDLANASVIDRVGALAGTENAYVGLRYCDLNEDFYSIDLEVGDTIRWVVSHEVGSGKDLDATIFLPDGSNPVSGTTTTDDEEVSYTATTAGVHTLRVYAKNPIRTDYRLLTYITPSGGMEVGPLDPDCPDDFENNDSAMEAVDVAPGTYSLLVCGQTPTGTDDDWYRTLLAPGETLTVRLDLLQSSGNIDLFMYEDGNFTLPIARSQSTTDVEEVVYTAQREQLIYYKVNTYSSVPSNAYDMTVTVTPAPACPDDSSEDNDTGATATSIDSPGFLDRRFKCEDDEDWYSFEVTENEQAEVYALFFDNADIDLFVYSDAAGTTLVDSGVTTNAGNESVVFTAPDDVATAAMDTQTVYTYFVRVDTKSRARIRYDLLVYRDLDGDGSFGDGEGNPDRNCPDRYENNDTRTTSASLAAGLYEDLRICQRGGLRNDPDYYDVFVPNGATLDVDLTFTHDDGNLQLAILRSNGTQAANSLSMDDNESASVTNDTGSGATYIVHIYGSGSGFENYYDLDMQLSFSNACPEDTTGAASLAAATTVLTPDNYADLALCEGTEDWFQISASNGERVLAEFELNNAFGNMDVELTDGTGAVLASSANDGNRETIDFTVGATGTYYIRVFSRNNVFIRNFYDMWLSIGGVDPAAPFCPDAYERNDIQESAAAVAFNGTQKLYSDMIACGADMDWYSVSGLTTGMYDLKTFFDAGPGADLNLSVLDNMGATIASATSTDNDESLVFSVSAGRTYFIGVENVAPSAVEVPYSMYVNRTNGACPEDSFEDNDTLAQSFGQAPLAPGRYAMGSCDEDYYRIEATNAGPMRIVISHDDADLSLLVRATDGGVSSNADSATPNRKIVDIPAVTAGEIIELYVGQISGNGPYLLDIQN